MSPQLVPTVAIVVPREMAPHFCATLHLLGEGAQVISRSEGDYGFALCLQVHIPGAPADAVRAEPTYRSVHVGNGHYRPELESITWYDARGKQIGAAA